MGNYYGDRSTEQLEDILAIIEDYTEAADRLRELKIDDDVAKLADIAGEIMNELDKRYKADEAAATAEYMREALV